MSADKPAKDAAPLAHVDSVQVEHKGLLRTPMLTVHGILPNPSYSIKDIVVESNGDSLTVKPVMQHDPEQVVIQITVRFSETVRLPRRAKHIAIESDHKTLQKQIE